MSKAAAQHQSFTVRHNAMKCKYNRCQTESTSRGAAPQTTRLAPPGFLCNAETRFIPPLNTLPYAGNTAQNNFLAAVYITVFRINGQCCYQHFYLHTGCIEHLCRAVSLHGILFSELPCNIWSITPGAAQLPAYSSGDYRVVSISKSNNKQRYQAH